MQCRIIFISISLFTFRVATAQNASTLDIGFSEDIRQLSIATGIIENIERGQPGNAYYFVSRESVTNEDSIRSFSERLSKVYTYVENSYPPMLGEKSQQGDIATYERMYYTYSKITDEIDYAAQIIVIIDNAMDDKRAYRVFYLTDDEIIPRDEEIRAVINRTYNRIDIPFLDLAQLPE